MVYFIQRNRDEGKLSAMSLISMLLQSVVFIYSTPFKYFTDLTHLLFRYHKFPVGLENLSVPCAQCQPALGWTPAGIESAATI